MVHICCRVSGHKAKNFGGGWQDGTEGNSRERASVQQKLRKGKITRCKMITQGQRKQDVSLKCMILLTGMTTPRLLLHTLVLFSKMSIPLRDRKRWTLLFVADFSEEYLSGV